MTRSPKTSLARHAVDASQAPVRREQKPVPCSGCLGQAGPQTVPNHAIGQALGAGAPLEPKVRADMEQRFGASFAEVRVHDDEHAHRSAADLEAKAYTHGHDIAFSAGRYAPQEADGRRLLAHELAHVVQQRRGGAAPGLAPSAPHEAAADNAARALTQGSGPVSVAGATGVGVAREPEDDPRRRPQKKAQKEPQKKTRPDEAGPVRRVGPATKGKASPKPVTITDPKKATGVLGEVTTPFELYRDPSWNHLGGGQETSSSRLSLARTTQWGDTGGLDFLVQNRKTGRLVLGEQKRLGSASFTRATAISRNLEKNIANTVRRLRAGIQAGRVHPEEIANVKDVIARLEQTGKALKNGTALPEEVVFELTATGGKSTKIGKDYIKMLAEKYDPKTIERILARTYIRGKGIGADPHGAVGTNADPDIVPAKDAMTEPARSELERLLAGKTPREWRAQKRQERKARAEARRRARKAKPQAKREGQSPERAKIEAQAKQVGDEVRRKTLEELREATRRSGDAEPRTKAQKRQADNALKKKATQAGKEAQKKVLDEARQRARAKPAAPEAKAPEAKVPVSKAPGAKPPETKVPETTVPETKVPETKAPAARATPSEPATPKAQAAKPTVPLEGMPRGVTPREALGGMLGAAGFLAAVSGVKDIVKEFIEGNPLTAVGKTGLLGLSFVPTAAPPLFAFGTIMNYWGPRHEAIQEDAYAVGDVLAEAAGEVPLLGRSETFRTVVGGVGAAGTAVVESMAYTVKDMGSAIADGAETLGDLAEDAYDWLTSGPSIFDLMQEEVRRRAGESRP